MDGKNIGYCPLKRRMIIGCNLSVLAERKAQSRRKIDIMDSSKLSHGKKGRKIYAHQLQSALAYIDRA